LKCVCGEWLDIKKGKYGPYFHCLNCGNVSFKKGLEINPNIEAKDDDGGTFTEKPHVPKEITVTSDELDFL